LVVVYILNIIRYLLYSIEIVWLVVFLSCFRYLQAIKNQSRWFALQQNSILWLGYFLIILGSSLNLCTLCSLGIKGAYFG